jgi:hypothetical protein
MSQPSRRQGESCDAGVADDATGGGQPVGLCLLVDVAPQGTTLHLGCAAVRVDPDGPHRREVDDDPVVAHSGAGHVVTPAPYRDLQVVLAGETHGNSAVRCIARSVAGSGRWRRSTRRGRCRILRGQP